MKPTRFAFLPWPRRHGVRAIVLLAASLLLTACGGGASVGGGQLAEGGIGGSGISKGPVTAYGSIVVNAVHFDVNHASYYRDGQPSVQIPAIGEVVTVTGDFDSDGINGSASRVDYRPLVIGPVDTAFDATSGTLTILGQTIHVDARTVFDGGSVATPIEKPADFKHCDTVEVSGLLRGDGSIQATLLRLKAKATTSSCSSPSLAASPWQLIGRVESLNSGAKIFSINGLVVNYASLGSYATGELQNGQFIEVYSNSGKIGGQLDASALHAFSQDIGADVGDEVELSGFVSGFGIVNGRFLVGGTRVTVDANTHYEDGTTADLANGAQVEVEGRINAAGLLVATEISFKQQGHNAITAGVQAKSCDTGDCLSGSLTLLGLIIDTDLHTIFESDDDCHDSNSCLNLASIYKGERLDIEARQIGAGGLLATSVERAEGSVGVALTGKISNLSGSQFRILGVLVYAAGATGVTGLQKGDLVKVIGTQNGSDSINATSVEPVEGEED